jgi:nucleotide-binding universal stress UspA family protein
MPHREDAPRPDASPIVVGVSGVTGSRAALQWAAHEARLRQGRVKVRAVMAWRGSGLPGGAPGRVPALSTIGAEPSQRTAQELLEEYVAEALGDDHDVECEAVQGSAQAVLVKEAEHASLLVVDSPSVAKLYEPMARRLAPKLIFRSPCPVVVMPALAVDEDYEAETDEDLGEYAGEGGRFSSGAAPTQGSAS